MTHDNPRSIALELLIKAEKLGQYSNIALDKALEGSSLSSPDKRLASVLFYGVTEKKITLDHRIAELSDRPIESIDIQTLSALRLGLYQLMFTDKIPPHAAINETVSLCSRKSSGFVNAILRSHTRKPPMALPSKESNPLEYLSVTYSICTELCDKFLGIYGFEKTEAIFKAFGAPPPTTLRVNTLVTSREELTRHIDGAVKTQFSPVGLSVRGAVRDIYGFDEGMFFVQDEASQICVSALDAKQGMTVMDICACPGSKSFGAGIDMKNEGKLYCFDLHSKKLPLIESGAKRLGISIISTQEQDGKLPLKEFFGCADRVLCDVPCSGFGVLAKKPELRYKSPEASKELPKVSLAILENASNYLKPGGVLVYSTCTLFPEENQNNVLAFLDKHPEFELAPFTVGSLECKQGYITLLPDEYPTDGFFIAKLKRKNT